MTQKGFTLIEVIIAITLLGLMMLGVYNVVDNSILTKEATLSEDAEIIQLETAFGRFERDFDCIYTPLFFAQLKKVSAEEAENEETSTYETTEKFPYITEKKNPVPFIDNPDKKTLIFMTSTNRRRTKNSNQSHYAWVKYTLADEGDDTSFVRYYSANDPYSGEHDWDEVKEHILIPKVKELKFEFWNTKREKYVDSLELTEDKNLIRRVKITLTWIDNQNIEQQIQRVFRSIWPYFDTSSDEQAMATPTPTQQNE